MVDPKYNSRVSRADPTPRGTGQDRRPRLGKVRSGGTESRSLPAGKRGRQRERQGAGSRQDAGLGGHPESPRPRAPDSFQSCLTQGFMRRPHTTPLTEPSGDQPRD